MRASIYARVSSDPHGNGRSVTEQVDECQAVIERNGWQLDRIFVDNDRSASRYAKKQRPEYKQLVEYVRAGQCDALVTWEASRFQRDLEDYVQLRELCRKAGVLWSYSGRTYDLTRTDDRLITGLDALLAERESDVARDRILRSMQANAVSGRPHGRIPYGYVREYDPRTGELVRQIVREDQASMIREAAQRFLSGETPNSIAKDWNRRGVPTSHNGVWDLSRVRRIILNPAVIAKRVHQGKVIGDADWPPILDESTYHQCAAKFADPARKTTNEHAVKYLLSGLAQCGVCGGRIKVMPQRGGYKCYICVNFCVARKVVWVDDLIEKLIIGRLSKPDALSLFTPEDDDTAALLDQAAEKRARLEAFYDSAADGDITPAALSRIEAKLLDEIEELEKRVRRYDVPTVMYELVREPQVVWTGLTLEQKRECVRCLLEIRLMPTKSGRKAFEPADVKVRFRESGEGGTVEPALEAALH